MLNKLKENYALRKKEIKSRLKEFEKVYKKSDKEIFEELCFCILTANASAEMALRAMEAIKGILMTGSVGDIRSALAKSGYRYPNKRAEYIVATREHLKKEINFELKKKIASFKDMQELRGYFVENVKGFGYKEASHFLRNIGCRGYAILDKHILHGICEFGAISSKDRPKNRKEYLRIEECMKAFAKESGIDFDELDLLLWSMKTGKVLK